MFARTVLALAAAVLLVAPAQAQKKPALGAFPFWSAPKNPRAHAFVPGLQAALELTPEQVEYLARALQIELDRERSGAR